MRLTLTDEQRLLEASALDLLEAEYDASARQASLAHREGCRPALWRQFAELGWLALPLPEQAGGLGCGLLETGLLMQALGRHLVVEPYLASAVLAGRLLAALGGAESDALLPRLLAGEQRAALAHAEFGVPDPYAAPSCRAEYASDGDRDAWRLHGFKPLVAGAPGAAALLVSARDAAGRCGVFLVPPDAPGLSLRACTLADGSRAADLRLDGAAALRLGPPEQDLLALLQRLLGQAAVAACWEALGVMRAAQERTAAYTAQRVQFGQPLARLQVVQHRLAEMLVCCEEARAACQLAALRIDLQAGDRDTALTMAAMAKSKVGRAARYVAQEAVQLHGAMGVCEELPVAASFRKLCAFGQQFGSTAWHAEWLGRSQLASQAWRGSQTLVEERSREAAT